MNKGVLLAMSGGIDSSVSAKMLLDKGFDVVGVTFIMFDEPNGTDFVITSYSIHYTKLYDLVSSFL